MNGEFNLRQFLTAAFAAMAIANPVLVSAAVALRPLPPLQPADDETAPLEPHQPRTERRQDRLHSMSLYAAARMADRANNFSQAMALYARAHRYDPENIDAMKRAVLLARVLGRHTLSARYASELMRQAPVETLDVLRGVLYLRQESRVAQALAVYEKAVSDRGKPPIGPALVELHKQAGEMYLQEKKYPQAADAFARVDAALKKPKSHGLDAETLKLIQGDVDALNSQIFDAYLNAGRYEPAADVLARLSKPGSDEGQIIYARAQLAAQQKQYEEASKLLDSYLKKKLTSQGEAPYQLLREVLDAQKRPEHLRRRLERSFALDDANQPLGCFLAAHYQAAGKSVEARALYEKLLARKPSSAGYQGLVGVLRRSGEIGPLLTALGNAVASSGGLSILGEEAVALSEDKDLQRKLVVEAQQRLQKKPPELKPGERLALALLSCNSKQYETAGQYFELAIEADPQQKGPLLSTWGLALIAGEQYAAGADVLQRALDEKAVSADNPALNYYLAGALSMVGRNAAALVAARKASLPDAPPEMASRVGWVHYRAKQYDEARKQYTDLIKRMDGAPDTSATRDAAREARLTLSHVCSLMDDPAQAEELLEQVLDEFPDSIGVKNDLGYLWADRGVHLERSLAMIQQAVDADPKNAAYRDSLGWVYFRLGRYPEAVKELQQAAAGEKPDATVLDHLGDALHGAGRTDEALAAWKRALDALKSEPDEKLIRTIQKKIDRRAEKTTR